MNIFKNSEHFNSFSEPELPTVNTVTDNYKEKYEDALRTIKALEDENIKLINDLVEYKAKLSTIKDIIE